MSFADRPGNDINGLTQIAFRRRRSNAARVYLYLPFISSFLLDRMLPNELPTNLDENVFHKDVSQDMFFYQIQVDGKTLRQGSRPLAVLFKKTFDGPMNNPRSSVRTSGSILTSDYSITAANDKYAGLEGSFISPIPSLKFLDYLASNRKAASMFLDVLLSANVTNEATITGSSNPELNINDLYDDDTRLLFRLAPLVTYNTIDAGSTGNRLFLKNTIFASTHQVFGKANKIQSTNAAIFIPSAVLIQKLFNRYNDHKKILAAAVAAQTPDSNSIVELFKSEKFKAWVRDYGLVQNDDNQTINKLIDSGFDGIDDMEKGLRFGRLISSIPIITDLIPSVSSDNYTEDYNLDSFGLFTSINHIRQTQSQFAQSIDDDPSLADQFVAKDRKIEEALLQVDWNARYKPDDNGIPVVSKTEDANPLLKLINDYTKPSIKDENGFMALVESKGRAYTIPSFTNDLSNKIKLQYSPKPPTPIIGIELIVADDDLTVTANPDSGVRNPFIDQVSPSKLLKRFKDLKVGDVSVVVDVIPASEIYKQYGSQNSEMYTPDWNETITLMQQRFSARNPIDLIKDPLFKDVNIAPIYDSNSEITYVAQNIVLGEANRRQKLFEWFIFDTPPAVWPDVPATLSTAYRYSPFIILESLMNTCVYGYLQVLTNLMQQATNLEVIYGDELGLDYNSLIFDPDFSFDPSLKFQINIAIDSIKQAAQNLTDAWTTLIASTSGEIDTNSDEYSVWQLAYNDYNEAQATFESLIQQRNTAIDNAITAENERIANIVKKFDQALDSLSGILAVGFAAYNSRTQYLYDNFIEDNNKIPLLVRNYIKNFLSETKSWDQDFFRTIIKSNAIAYGITIGKSCEMLPRTLIIKDGNTIRPIVPQGLDLASLLSTLGANVTEKEERDFYINELYDFGKDSNDGAFSALGRIANGVREFIWLHLDDTYSEDGPKNTHRDVATDRIRNLLSDHTNSLSVLGQIMNSVLGSYFGKNDADFSEAVDLDKLLTKTDTNSVKDLIKSLSDALKVKFTPDKESGFTSTERTNEVARFLSRVTVKGIKETSTSADLPSAPIGSIRSHAPTGYQNYVNESALRVENNCISTTIVDYFGAVPQRFASINKRSKPSVTQVFYGIGEDDKVTALESVSSKVEIKITKADDGFYQIEFPVIKLTRYESSNPLLPEGAPQAEFEMDGDKIVTEKINQNDLFYVVSQIIPGGEIYDTALSVGDLTHPKIAGIYKRIYNLIVAQMIGSINLVEKEVTKANPDSRFYKCSHSQVTGFTNSPVDAIPKAKVAFDLNFPYIGLSGSTKMYPIVRDDIYFDEYYNNSYDYMRNNVELTDSTASLSQLYNRNLRIPLFGKGDMFEAASRESPAIYYKLLPGNLSGSKTFKEWKPLLLTEFGTEETGDVTMPLNYWLSAYIDPDMPDDKRPMDPLPIHKIYRNNYKVLKNIGKNERAALKQLADGQPLEQMTLGQFNEFLRKLEAEVSISYDDIKKTINANPYIPVAFGLIASNKQVAGLKDEPPALQDPSDTAKQDDKQVIDEAKKGANIIPVAQQDQKKDPAPSEDIITHVVVTGDRLQDIALKYTDSTWTVDPTADIYQLSQNDNVFRNPANNPLNKGTPRLKDPSGVYEYIYSATAFQGFPGDILKVRKRRKVQPDTVRTA